MCLSTHHEENSDFEQVTTNTLVHNLEVTSDQFISTLGTPSTVHVMTLWVMIVDVSLEQNHQTVQ